MTAFSLSARLYLGANSRLALSLPQSRCFNPFSPRQLPPQREPRRLRRKATDLALLSKFGANAVTGRGYNPSGFLPRRGKKPAPLTPGSQDSHSSSLGEHRGAEIRAQFALLSTGEPQSGGGAAAGIIRFLFNSTERSFP